MSFLSRTISNSFFNGSTHGRVARGRQMRCDEAVDASKVAFNVDRTEGHNSNLDPFGR